MRARTPRASRHGSPTGRRGSHAARARREGRRLLAASRSAARRGSRVVLRVMEQTQRLEFEQRYSIERASAGTTASSSRTEALQAVLRDDIFTVEAVTAVEKYLPVLEDPSRDDLVLRAEVASLGFEGVADP